MVGNNLWACLRAGDDGKELVLGRSGFNYWPGEGFSNLRAFARCIKRYPMLRGSGGMSSRENLVIQMLSTAFSMPFNIILI